MDDSQNHLSVRDARAHFAELYFGRETRRRDPSDVRRVRSERSRIGKIPERDVEPVFVVTLCVDGNRERRLRRPPERDRSGRGSKIRNRDEIDAVERTAGTERLIGLLDRATVRRRRHSLSSRRCNQQRDDGDDRARRQLFLGGSQLNIQPVGGPTKFSKV